MAMKTASLGTRTIEEIHEQAILLWIHSKKKDPELNPAHGIFIALTNNAWPTGLPEVSNAIELCSILNQAFGLPPLSENEAKALNVKALSVFNDYKRSMGPIRFFGHLIWANRLAYVLALASLVVSGRSWLVIGLAVAVWLCFGAARTAARMGKEESRPSWEVPVIAAMHLVALIGLYAVSLFHLLKS